MPFIGRPPGKCQCCKLPPKSKRPCRRCNSWRLTPQPPSFLVSDCRAATGSNGTVYRRRAGRGVACLAARRGGFAVVTDDPGNRQLRLSAYPRRAIGGGRDVNLGMISRPRPTSPTSGRPVRRPTKPHNRWGAAKILRQSWQAHIDTALSRPVLIVDEAQEIGSPVLSELRLFASAKLNSYFLPTVVCAGDTCLIERCVPTSSCPSTAASASVCRSSAPLPRLSRAVCGICRIRRERSR